MSSSVSSTSFPVLLVWMRYISFCMAKSSLSRSSAAKNQAVSAAIASRRFFPIPQAAFSIQIHFIKRSRILQGKRRKKGGRKAISTKILHYFQIRGDIWRNPILRHSIRRHRHTGLRPYGRRSRIHDRSTPGDHAVDIGSYLVDILSER